MKKYIPLTLLIALNLYPIVGIIFLKWDINFTFFTYLAETLVLVVFATIKMFMSKRLWDDESARLNPHWSKYSRKYTILNLIAMLYVFTVVLYALYLVPWNGGIPGFGFSIKLINYDVLVSFLLFSIVSHTVSFFMYFIIGKERETIATSAIFNRVMIGRILPLFLTPFVIAFLLTLNLANTVAPIIIILLLMTFFDVLAHLREHGYMKNLPPTV